ncbi:uncharacterized protein [Dermacentor albipictus]|uniref:uncharacterized protein n=1 Tax=Dermacentor albipictus TaxID=60249 RepID=UPI0038FBEE54
MGDHVLVKWTTEDKWDVYPLRNIKSQEVICQLLDDPRSIKALATEEVEVLVTGGHGKEADQTGSWPTPSEQPCWKEDLEKMAKNLKKATQELTGSMSVASSAPATLPVCKLDIGDGVLVEKQLVDRISLSAKHQPSKFARALLRVVFSPEELENSSLYGKVCRANKDAAPKKALDQKRVEAVVSYTCSLYNVGVKEVKGSLSAMLARGQVH